MPADLVLFIDVTSQRLVRPHLDEPVREVTLTQHERLAVELHFVEPTIPALASELVDEVLFGNERNRAHHICHKAEGWACPDSSDTRLAVLMLLVTGGFEVERTDIPERRVLSTGVPPPAWLIDAALSADLSVSSRQLDTAGTARGFAPAVPHQRVLELLADRLGGGSGRVYNITVEARDLAGNANTRVTSVVVPHNQR